MTKPFLRTLSRSRSLRVAVAGITVTLLCGGATAFAVPALPQTDPQTAIHSRGREALRELGRLEENKNLIAERVGSNTRFDFFRGNDASAVQSLNQTDTELVTGAAFAQCNNGVSYAQLMMPPIVVSSGCFTWYMFTGKRVGRAWNCKGGTFFCPCVCIIADVVEYNFPTMKANLSEQMWQSELLDKSTVELEFIPEMRTLRRQAEQQVVEGVKVATKTLKDHLAEQRVSVQAVEPQRPASFANQIDATLIQPNNEDLGFLSGDRQRHYLRLFSEQANTDINSYYWIPHVPRNTFFGTDFPAWAGYAHFLSMSSGQTNSKLAAKYRTFSEKRNAGLCFKNNKRRGKMPQGLGPWNLDSNFNSAAAEEICLDDVGLITSPLAGGYNQISDATFAGLKKGLDIFRAVLTPSSIAFGPGRNPFSGDFRHTFLDTVDSFYILRPDALRAEGGGGCLTLDQLAKDSSRYREFNIKEFGSGAQSTMEVFTRFRGAFGFQGVAPPMMFSNGAPCPGPGGFCRSGVTLNRQSPRSTPESRRWEGLTPGLLREDKRHLRAGRSSEVPQPPGCPTRFRLS